MEDKVMTINQALKQVDRCQRNVTDQQATIEVHIRNSFQRLQEILDIRKSQLMSQLHQTIRSKLDSLAAQRIQLSNAQAQVIEGLDSLRKSVSTKNAHQVLNTKRRISAQIEKLAAPIHKDILLPCTEADLQYSGSADTLGACSFYGHLMGPCLDPSKCSASGFALEVVSTGEISTITVHAISHKGQPFSQPVAFECVLISETPADIRVLGSVKRTEQNIYMISYQPTIKGKHQLHIRADGQHIKGSPFNITALESPIQKIGTSVRSVMEVNGPHSIAVNKEHELMITGLKEHSVHVLNLTTMQQFSLRSRGDIHYPMGIAVDTNDNILLVDSKNCHALKKTARGQVYFKGKMLQCKQPYGVTFNAKNDQIYVTDTYSNCVHILNSHLKYLKSFGGGKGQFTCPQAIACDSAGNVYVTDHNCVQVFTADMMFLRAFGKYGQCEGELDFPSGIAVDENGLVYVSEANNHRVSVFTPQGLLVKTFGKCGSKPGQFKYPCGLAVDSEGRVYVCDTNNDRIQVF